MNYTVEKQTDYTLITLADESLDTNISSEVKMLAVDLTKEGEKSLLINLEHCKTCDDSGLSALLIANRLCKNVRGKCVLMGVNDYILNQIHAFQLEIVLTVVATQEDAQVVFEKASQM